MNWLTSRVATVAVPLALLALAGCDKGTDLNVDLPDTTGISTDYLDLDLGAQAATVRLQPVSTLKAEHYLVGRLSEGVAGTTTARSYLNVLLPVLPDSLPSKFADPRLDSVVMVLTYDRVYGSTTAPVRLNIGNLPARLDDRAVYDSSTPPISNVEWLRTNVPGKIDRTRQVTSSATTSNPAVTTTVPDPSVRLVLQRGAAIPSAFFDDVFASLKAGGFTQAKLDAKLRGLALEPASGYNGSILSMGRVAIGRIELFFHDEGATVPTKWHAFPLVFGPVYSASGQASALDPRYYTQLESDLSNSALSALALPGSVGVPAASLNNTSYLQEGNGIGTRVALSNLPKLEALRNLRGLAINRAELRVPIKPYSNLLFPNSPLLYLLEANASNEVLQRTLSYVPYDRVVQTDGANPRGAGEIRNFAFGTIVNGGTSQPYYSILLTTYLQAYLNNNLDGELPASLILMPTVRQSSTLSLNRTAIDADNIHLFVYYSQQ
ncbi:DUF4270 family protein [Hymenobacter sp. ASUV-10]|uniref:DUF4270 family protein n=1 Tax=Hymenobacter aranciens TaxID=3063996 RepID=A0ABT9B4Q2_9BACT|nr:DUF4270 family protein [Hymenobacter sp. ASUV-10]MDO7873239.1 DUF4270 family protein [Hymenobacter sp. ASUV-10]